MDILSRSDAIIQKHVKFFTGIPCRRGHLSERYVSTGNCIACLRPGGVKNGSTPRDMARLMGSTTYQSGQPCRHGHTSPRYVSTGGCIECLHSPLNGIARVTLTGSMQTIEQLLEYHAYLVGQEPSPLTVEHMAGGPRLAALNLQRVLKRRGAPT